MASTSWNVDLDRRMRGTQPAGPASGPQGGYALNGNQGAATRRGTTPTTPQFPAGNGNGNVNGYNAGPAMGVHDCIQLNGAKPLYLCQPYVIQQTRPIIRYINDGAV